MKTLTLKKIETTKRHYGPVASGAWVFGRVLNIGYGWGFLAQAFCENPRVKEVVSMDPDPSITPIIHPKHTFVSSAAPPLPPGLFNFIYFDIVEDYDGSVLPMFEATLPLLVSSLAPQGRLGIEWQADVPEERAIKNLLERTGYVGTLEPTRSFYRRSLVTYSFGRP